MHGSCARKRDVRAKQGGRAFARTHAYKHTRAHTLTRTDFGGHKDLCLMCMHCLDALYVWLICVYTDFVGQG